MIFINIDIIYSTVTQHTRSLNDMATKGYSCLDTRNLYMKMYYANYCKFLVRHLFTFCDIQKYIENILSGLKLN